jgi:DNA-binding SARP family transcriptional activator/CheY-like chemotaxis protein
MISGNTASKQLNNHSIAIQAEMSKNLHTILVVDPDERSYRTFESVLGERNRVLFVPNGKTAIDLPDSHNIDIVFISHVLNGTDGIMLLESFKKRFPSLPVVLVAERPKVDEVITAFRSGARELIEKPIDENELLAVTQKIFRFVSDIKPRRKWFFRAKKGTPNIILKKNSKEHLKKNFQRSKQAQNFSEDELNDIQMNETMSLIEDSNNKLIADASTSPKHPNKETHFIAQKEASHSMIEAFFLGSFRVFVNTPPIENWPSKKGKSIFAYLLLNHKKKIFRDILMDIFWQKSSPDSARNCLNVSIHGIRRVLQDIDPKTEYILFKNECYYFNPEVEIQLDVDTFRSIWRKAQSTEHAHNLSAAVSQYERAAEIYKGDFLEDELYDDWLSLDRENLKEVYLVILDKISENLIYHNKHHKAIRVCENILEKDNCREDIYRRLMVCYYRIGQRDKSLRLFRKCSTVLKEELEVKLASSTIELYRKIKENQL